MNPTWRGMSLFAIMPFILRAFVEVGQRDLWADTVAAKKRKAWKGVTRQLVADVTRCSLGSGEERPSDSKAAAAHLGAPEPEVRRHYLDSFGPSELRALGPLRFRGLEWSGMDAKGL